MDQDQLNPVHPGGILLKEFLKPFSKAINLSQNQMAPVLRVPAHRINGIVYGKRRITANTALRLALY